MNTYYDHGTWKPLPDNQLIADDTDPVIAWNITWQRNPWFSLGIHVDHKWPCVEVHVPGVFVRLGRQDHWGGEHGIRKVAV